MATRLANAQNYHTKNNSSRVQFTLGFAFIATKIAGISSHGYPSGEPQQREETVDRSESVDITEPSSTRPYRHSDEIDEAGNGEPALENITNQ